MNEKSTHILVCEPGVEGILSAVYAAYVSRYGHRYQKIMIGPYVNESLFSEIINIQTDLSHAESIAKAIVEQLSWRIWWMVWQTAESDDADRGDIIYRFLILAFANGRKMIDAMAIPEVMRLNQLSQMVSRETQHLLGFLRFQELTDHTLYARLISRHHVGAFLAIHFTDRMPEESWIIHDLERDEAWVHPKGGEWELIKHPQIQRDPQEMKSVSEFYFETWWKTFTQSIAIYERANPKLQMQMMPKRYWKYMPECGREN